jgi:TonB family protein
MSRSMIRVALSLVSLTLAGQAGAAGEATVQGSLDKAVIRRVIQQHINEVKTCYEAELEKNASLAGRLMVRFTVEPDGKVSESSVQESSLKSPAAEGCIRDAVRTWIFPKPQGGKVVVTYPFVLASAPPSEKAAPGGK